MSDYRTIKDIRGKAIVSAGTGQKMGTVSGVMLDPATLRVAALTTSKGNLLRPETEMIPADKVQVYGRDVILVSNGDALIRDLGDAEERPWVDASDYVQGKSVISIEGQRLGQVSDILLDEQGRIVGYDLDRVEASSPLAGSKFVPARATHSLGKDVLIVDLARAHAAGQERREPEQRIARGETEGVARAYEPPPRRTQPASVAQSRGAPTVELPERGEQ